VKSKSFEAAGTTENPKPRHGHWPFSPEPNSSRALEILLRLIALALALLCIGSMRARAYGPDFPNYTFDDGMKDQLVAPRADFASCVSWSVCNYVPRASGPWQRTMIRSFKKASRPKRAICGAH